MKGRKCVQENQRSMCGSWSGLRVQEGARGEITLEEMAAGWRGWRRCRQREPLSLPASRTSSRLRQVVVFIHHNLTGFVPLLIAAQHLSNLPFTLVGSTPHVFLAVSRHATKQAYFSHNAYITMTSNSIYSSTPGPR